MTELALAAIDPHKRRPLHLSLDIDSADPVFAPGTGTTASGGLTPRELEYLCAMRQRYGLQVDVERDMTVPESIRGEGPEVYG